MGVRDWDIVTSYVDSVTTTLKTVTFPKVQEQVKAKNQGNANLTYTIGTQTGTLTPGQSVTVNEAISSFTIQSVSGVQSFEVRAVEKGTEQTETETDVMSLLAEKAKQTDVNNSLALKSDKTYVDTELAKKVNKNELPSTAYKYKGTVAASSNLPASSNTIGDQYFVSGENTNYAWTGTAWQNIGSFTVLPEAVGTKNIASKNVTPEKTSFIKTGKNLIDLSTNITGYVLNADGTLTANVDRITTDFIEIVPNSIVYFGNNGTDTQTMTVALVFNANRQVISPNFGWLSQVTLGAEAKYVRISFATSNTKPQLEYGSRTVYETYRLTLDNLLVDDKNIINKSTDIVYTNVQINAPNSKIFPDFSTTTNKLTLYNGGYGIGIRIGDTTHSIVDGSYGNLTVDLTKTISSSLGKIIFNTDTKTFSVIDNSVATKYPVVGSIRYTTITVLYLNLGCPYTIDGKLFGIIDTPKYDLVKNPLGAFVKGIAHRGYQGIDAWGPENTLVGFQLAKDKGFSYVETDVRFTSDAIPVMIHDDSINRTARNADGTQLASTVYIANITLAEAKTYDFGIGTSSAYAGEKIASFEEFILFCKKRNLSPYIELKTGVTNAQAQTLVNITRKLGMLRNVAWTSYLSASLTAINTYDNKAKLGLIGTISTNLINSCIALKTATNEVLIADDNYRNVTASLVEQSLLNDIEVITGGVTTETPVPDLAAAGVSGIVTDFINISKALGNS